MRVPGAGPHNTLKPNYWGSKQSKLTTIFTKGHENPDIDAKRKELGVYVDKDSDPEAFLRVATWIDINAPYYPTYGSAYRDNPRGRSPITVAETRRLEELTGFKGLELEKRISFDRPQLSPCLNRWGAADAQVSPEYREALAIISSGKERLEKQGRGEEEDFRPVAAVEIEQEKRYEYFQARADAVKEAKSAGKKLNDLDVDRILGDSWE